VNPALVYLDHAATTPMRAEAIEAMLPFLSERFANPSGSHRFAREARRAIDEARDVVADALGCRAGDVVFTGGGTEADNTAIRGVVEAHPSSLAVCPAAEHHAVLECVRLVGGRIVTVEGDAAVSLDSLRDLLRADSGRISVVSVMAVNNEVGTINDLAAVAAVVRAEAPDAVLHTDAVQAAHWLDLAEVARHVDMLSLSAHKFGGPKGVGVLMARSDAKFRPLVVGGGQERDRRSGTQDVGGIVAASVALRLAQSERSSTNAHVAVLRDRLLDGLQEGLEGVHETVSRDRVVAGTAHVCIEGIENEALLFLLDEASVCASAASACAAGAMEASHVLAAMGVAPSLAAGALRMSLGPTTTADEIDRATEVLVTAITQLRRRVAR